MARPRSRLITGLLPAAPPRGVSRRSLAEGGSSVMRRIHHVGIVVNRLADAYGFYRDTLGLPLLKEATIPDQHVRAALLGAGESEVELLEPLDPSSGVGRFLARHGEGLHHLCFDTPDIVKTLTSLKEMRVELLDPTPRPGLAGQIAFVHPKACCGVLVELATPSAAAAEAPSPLRLKRLVIGASDVKRSSDVLRSLFGLEEVAMNDGPRAMLAVGRGALLVVPAEEVGGTEGLVALSMVAEDFSALTDAFSRAGTTLLRGTGEVTVQPASSHGVPLHISRYE
ncbi:MAG: methylmalonyl-CoA epimerase [Candidatus Rokuibacteriota bacterium]|nr:MAG: methylmalonyl-CoA epimerase [Candidatus Rokubacteria bacterium]